MEECGNSEAKSLCLCPAAVGERGVIGGWRCEVPLLVGGIEAGAVAIEVCVSQDWRVQARGKDCDTYRAMITTAGALGMS
jgi:hypothetical protein